MPALSPPSATACAGRAHRPSPAQTDIGGIRRTRCRTCGLRLMRTAISRRWIVADQLG